MRRAAFLNGRFGAPAPGAAVRWSHRGAWPRPTRSTPPSSPISPRRSGPPDDLTRRLRELLARRRQLVVMINAEKQRLAKAEDKIAQRSCKAVLKSLIAERERIDRAIDKVIGTSPL
jgi:hypothetical protein